MAEVLKLAARPTPYDNDERTWLEFRFKLENYLTLSIRTLSHTLYALLATLTTGRSLRLVRRVPNRNGLEVWRQLVAENAPKTVGRKFAMLQAVLQPGMGDNPAFEETWKT